MQRSTTVLLAALLAAAPGYARAAISGVSGQTTWLTTPPASCTLGALQGVNAHAWDEKTNVPLSLAVDMINNGPNSGAVPGTLSGVFDSHFIHYEGIPGVITASGSVTFNAPIVGVIFQALTLDASDAPAGWAATVYPTTYPFRGIAGNPPSTFVVAGNTISFTLNSLAPSNFVVQMRVLTPHVPAPGPASLLGLAGLAASRRRRG